MRALSGVSMISNDEEEPHFDPCQPHGQVFGMPGVKWEQDGHYYSADHTLVDISSIERSEQAVEKVPEQAEARSEGFCPPVFCDLPRRRIAQRRDERIEAPLGAQTHGLFVDGGQPDAHGWVWWCHAQSTKSVGDDLAAAIEQMADDVRLERTRDLRHPGPRRRERDADEWERLEVDGAVLHDEIHGAILFGDVNLEPVQDWASMQRLFGNGAFRALRNVPAAQVLRDGAVKPRTMVDLWLWMRLPEHPGPGKQINVKKLLLNLTKWLKDEDWSAPLWCLNKAEAAKFQSRLAKYLNVTPRRFLKRLIAIKWHEPKPRVQSAKARN
jgi:hypothetical protein